MFRRWPALRTVRPDRDRWLHGGIGLSAVVSLLIGIYFSSNYFFGDDFPLIADAIEGTSPWAPVSSHLRPLVRLHFRLFLAVPYAAVFHLVSLALHGLACFTLYLVFRERLGPRIAATGGLLFFTCFAGNEAVFWISSVGILYCLIFSNLSLFLYLRGKTVASHLFLLLALLSYELWMVVPALLVVLARRRRDLLFPAGLLLLQGGIQIIAFGFRPDRYGGFSLAEFPDRFSVYATQFVAPFQATPGGWWSLLLGAGILGLLARKAYRIPALWYSAAAVILGFSSMIPMRFHYFPGVALVILLASLAGESRSWIRYPAVFLVVCVAGIAPLLNYLDGRDYRNWSEGHRYFQGWVNEAVARIEPGHRFTLVNRVPQGYALALSRDFRGRPKSVFIRPRAIGGLIYPEDAVRIALHGRGREARNAPCSREAIILGAGELVSRHCFESSGS